MIDPQASARGPALQAGLYKGDSFSPAMFTVFCQDTWMYFSFYVVGYIVIRDSGKATVFKYECDSYKSKGNFPENKAFVRLV